MAGKVPDIIEQLAAIEHERWADWMQYMLDCAAKSGDDTLGIRTCGWPTTQYENWLRQIETDYADLSELEKQSDREQVARYWPLIAKLVEQAKRDHEAALLDAGWTPPPAGDW